MRPAVASFILSAVFVGAAHAQQTLAGDFTCTVTEKAGIGALHLEDAPAPSAFITEGDTRFRMRITQDGERVVAVELPYNGTDRQRLELHTPNSILHAAYVGGEDGNLAATEDQAFLRIFRNLQGNLSFYHAGFEYPGGEDTNLSVRYGECVRD